MKLTHEQEDIINSSGDIKINVVAASCKNNKSWNPDQDEKFTEMFNNNTSASKIIKDFRRIAGDIRARLRKLALK